MARGELTIRAQLRRDFRARAEEYFRAITDTSWAQDHVRAKRELLAQVALRLHLFEQGRRSARARSALKGKE
jgi:hypothetical protein